MFNCLTAEGKARVNKIYSNQSKIALAIVDQIIYLQNEGYQSKAEALEKVYKEFVKVDHQIDETLTSLFG